MRPDTELVARAKAGDTEAMDALVDRHHASVYRVCISILGDPDGSEDAVQDTFIKALRGLKRFRGDASFRTWLLTVAGNEARGALRRAKRRRESTLDESRPVPSADPDILEKAAVSDEADRIRELVGRLPEKQRLSVTLRIDEGLSFREIGEIIGSSEGSARVNYHHGIRRLRELAAQ